MERTERIVILHNILVQARLPVARRVLEEKLECSEKSVRRTIEFLRDRLGAPIEYDNKRNGYYYPQDQRALYQLPGLWLSEKEIYALLAIQQLMGHFDPDFLQDEIQLLEERVQDILRTAGGVTPETNLAQFIHLIPHGRRQRQYQHFQIVAGACLQRKRLQTSYYSRSDNARGDYDLSPQKLIFYRDNWYLAAWWHAQQRLRLFSLDRFECLEKLDQPSVELDEDQLSSTLFSSFGIFSGVPNDEAVLRFSAEAARWIADEVWHPQQQAQWLEDGCYLLRIPYANPTELIGDILRYGAGVEVLEPLGLRQAVQQKLQQALDVYSVS